MMKELKLLEEQISKLDAPDFNLKAWKQYTIIILSRIFGDDNQKIRQIEKIEVDYTSWSLRDASGKSSHLETCKRLGKEVLLAAIDEISVFGTPEKQSLHNDSVLLNAIVKALEDELKISQLKEMVSIINSNTDSNIKRNELIRKINSFDHQVLVNLLANILNDNSLKGKI
jgi:hypothetical protein